VNPQWLTIIGPVVTAAAANQVRADVLTTTVPIYPIGSSDKSSATILEILKVHFNIDPAHNSQAPVGAVATEFHWALGHSVGETRATGATAELSTFILGLQSGLLTFGSIEEITDANGTNIESRISNPYNVVMDLTDGAGHGVLYANPTITLSTTQQSSTTLAWANFNIVVRLLYRYKKVGLTEYIGLVQAST